MGRGCDLLPIAFPSPRALYPVRMTFNPNAEIRSSNTRSGGGGGGFRPGRGGIAIGGGASGVVILIIVLIMLFTGRNPLDLLGTQPQAGQQQHQPAQGGELEHCQTGADANKRDDCLVQASVESTDSVWAQVAPASGIQFREAQARVFEGSVQTGCGAASSATGPFYCPADETIYVDVSFFQELESQFGSDGGQLAKIYVVAHEYGHHIQRLDGTLEKADMRDTGPQGQAVRLELQADCYAGLWAHHASKSTDDEGRPMLEPLTRKDIESALSAASAVGDDHIQGELGGGQVTPETWTHGSSQQRTAWFIRGYEQGTVKACNTFAVDKV